MIQSVKLLGVYYSTSSSNSEWNDLESNMNHLNSQLNPASIEPWFITGLGKEVFQWVSINKKSVVDRGMLFLVFE